MNLWYCICLLFFLNSIFILIDERNDVTYHLEDDLNRKEQYSVCLELNKIYKNESEINLNKLSNEVCNYLKKNFELNRIRLILKEIRLKNYYIYKGMFCLVAMDAKKFKDLSSSNVFKIFFVFEDCQFFQLFKNLSRFKKIVIYNLESSYSNCEFSTKFNCINQCMINDKGFKLSKYYYSSNANGIVKIKYDNNDNKIIKNEIECVKLCKKYSIDNCKLIYFKNYFEIKKNEKHEYYLFRAYLKMSSFDYWAQFLGLFSLIFELSLSFFLIKLIKLSIRYLNKCMRKKIRKYFQKIESIILLILLICLFSINIRLYSEFIDKRYDPIKREITLIESQLKPTVLIVCIMYVSIGNNNDEFDRKTLFQLQNNVSLIDLFHENIKDIYLEYFESQKIKINYKLNVSKVIFKFGYRCIQIELFPFEFKYQNQILLSELIVEYKSRRRPFLHLLTSNENNLNSKSYQLSYSLSFSKKEIRRSKFNKNCTYNKDNYDLVNKLILIDNCVVRKFIDNNKNISKLCILNRDFFTNTEWSRLFINHSGKANHDYELYLNECKIKYSDHLKFCYEDKFKDHLKINRNMDKKEKFKLYGYNIEKEIEEEPSIYKLLMDMLNIQSIIFGLNIFKLIWFIFKILKIKFNKLLIYLLCTIGFIYHLWFLIDEIINDGLIYSQHFRQKKNFKMPDIVFCTKHNALIDLNHKLTYRYLGKLTKELRKEKIIKEINYLDEFNRWIKLNQTSLNRIKIDTFYFLDKKCFQLRLKIIYKRTQFEFGDFHKNKVIKIFLNQTFIVNNGNLVILTKLMNELEFSQLILMTRPNGEISIELMNIDYDDKFNLIKNPLSILFDKNDANKYLIKLINKFRSVYKLNTLNLPLYNISNHFVIDNHLFDQFYLQVQNLTDINDRYLNYRRTFIINNLENQIYVNDSQLSFNLIFFRKIIIITNEDNYTKLLLNLLNLLSLWLDLSLLDLHICLDFLIIKFKLIVIKLRKLSIQFDNYFKNELN